MKPKVRLDAKGRETFELSKLGQITVIGDGTHPPEALPFQRELLPGVYFRSTAISKKESHQMRPSGEDKFITTFGKELTKYVTGTRVDFRGVKGTIKGFTMRSEFGLEGPKMPHYKIQYDDGETSFVPAEDVHDEWKVIA